MITNNSCHLQGSTLGDKKTWYKRHTQKLFPPLIDDFTTKCDEGTHLGDHMIRQDQGY